MEFRKTPQKSDCQKCAFPVLTQVTKSLRTVQGLLKTQLHGPKGRQLPKTICRTSEFRSF